MDANDGEYVDEEKYDKVNKEEGTDGRARANV